MYYDLRWLQDNVRLVFPLDTNRLKFLSNFDRFFRVFALTYILPYILEQSVE